MDPELWLSARGALISEAASSLAVSMVTVEPGSEPLWFSLLELEIWMRRCC